VAASDETENSTSHATYRKPREGMYVESSHEARAS